MPNTQVTGVILAGGLARRMGGVDKGRQLLDGQALVEHVAARLAPQVRTLLINANRSQDDYATLGYRLIGDALADFPGPLAGLHAGLAVTETPFVITAPCDSPYLPMDLVARLYAALQQSDSQLAIATAGGRQHPVFCLCHRDRFDSLDHFLRNGGRKVMQWCQENSAVEVDFPEQIEAFRNFNTLDDLKAP